MIGKALSSCCVHPLQQDLVFSCSAAPAVSFLFSISQDAHYCLKRKDILLNMDTLTINLIPSMQQDWIKAKLTTCSPPSSKAEPIRGFQCEHTQVSQGAVTSCTGISPTAFISPMEEKGKAVEHWY